MEIRLFQSIDKPQIVTLMSEFGDYIEEIDPMERTSYPDGGSEYFSDKLIDETNSNNGAIYVAEDNGRIVGFIGGYVSKQSEDELMEAKVAVPGIINEFFVTRTLRSKGVGKALLLVLESYLKQRGCTLIRLQVFAPNRLAREFYAKQGFQDRIVTISKDII